MNRREVEEIAIAIGLLAAATVVYLGATASVTVSVQLPDVEGFVSGNSGLIAIGLSVVLSAVLGLTIAALAVRTWFGGGVRAAGTVGRVWDRVKPDSTIGQGAVGFTFAIVLLIGAIGAIPLFVGDLGGAESGAAQFAEQLDHPSLNSDWDSIIADDDVEQRGACGTPPADRGEDLDRDGIPDAWERAGATPGGTPLPGADPGRKDLYVQVNYGDTVDHLSEDDRQQLVETWSELQVSNPDGSTGITVHLEDRGPNGGDLGRRAVFSSPGGADRFYDRSVMGDRLCVYHGVTVGQVEIGDTLGLAATPGFHVAVDGTTRPGYDGAVDFRVALITHLLLHNAVGEVDGDVHTADGWLSGGPDNEYLSNATRTAIENEGLTPIVPQSA